MKKLYPIILSLLLIASFPAFAQVIIYHENFSGTVTGVSSTNASWESDATTPNATVGASGGNYLRTSLATTVPASKVVTLNNSIATYGFKNLTITWNAYRTQNWQQGNKVYPSFPNTGNASKIDNTNPVVLEYSTDGVNYSSAGISSDPNTTTFAAWYSVNAITLPAALLEKANVRFRWRITVDNTNQDYYAIDDITIVGTPDDDLSTPESDLSVLDWSTRPKNENPFAPGKSYSVDNNLVTFSRASAAGVTALTAKVTDSIYQAPSKTLTLIQKGATGTNGTTITIRFAEPVADLTFSLLDVDQASGQFQDRIVINGTGYNGQVLLAKTKVITTSKNQLSTDRSLLGISGSDVAATSTDGNVKISFSEAVGEVRITYYNTDATRNNEGRQGIALHNLNWRRDRSIINPLPVTLMSFKGSVQDGAAKLAWSTASEKDNDRFVVERSQDGKTFEAIGTVKGNGNSSVVLKYNHTDYKPLNGTSYYRLRQIDYDGKETLSHVIALSTVTARLQAAELASVYPTLATSEVTVKVQAVSGAASVFVADATGKNIAQYQPTSAQEIVMPVQGLKSGVYFVTVVDGGQRETKRFVKQ